MKVLCFLSSHKKNGITGTALKILLSNLSENCKYEVIYLDDYKIEPNKKNESSIVLEELYSKMKKADAYVFAAPTYWRELSGLMKHFFDCLRPKIVHFKNNGDTIPGDLKGKKYLSIVSCYTSSLENFFTGVTDDSFKTIDRVMSAAGTVKIGEVVITNTFKRKTISNNKIKILKKYSRKIDSKKKRINNTMKRYIQLFFMISVMSLITMAIQKFFSNILSTQNFWINYLSFTIIFFILLSLILHFFTFVKHRRR
ncbi:flavodoxin family protein [Lactobacillus terrae]|uniref:flavodoxin family protein n=1 Tax=Lactobacillus terrae TaxID=2269374 RepID=UPI000C1B6F4C|nr:flavodoxin family protein [Lactobacillus terrae]